MKAVDQEMYKKMVDRALEQLQKERAEAQAEEARQMQILQQQQQIQKQEEGVDTVQTDTKMETDSKNVEDSPPNDSLPPLDKKDIVNTWKHLLHQLELVFRISVIPHFTLPFFLGR